MIHSPLSRLNYGGGLPVETPDWVWGSGDVFWALIFREKEAQKETVNKEKVLDLSRKPSWKFIRETIADKNNNKNQGKEKEKGKNS